MFNQNGLNKQQLVLPTKQQNNFQSINYLPNLPLHQNQKPFYKKNKSFIYHTNYVGYQNGYQNNYLNKNNFHSYNVKSQHQSKNGNYNRNNNHQTSDLKYDSTGTSVTPTTPSSGSNSMNTTDSSSNSSTSSNIITSNSQSQNNDSSQVCSTTLTNSDPKQIPSLNKKSEINVSNNEPQTINGLVKDLNNLNFNSQNKASSETKSNSLKNENGNFSSKSTHELNSSNGALNKTNNHNNYKLKVNSANNKYTQNKIYQNNYSNNYNSNGNANGNIYYNKLNNYNIATNYRSKKHVSNIHLSKNNSNQNNLQNFKNVNVHSKQVHQQNLHKNFYEGVSNIANGNPSVPTNSHSLIPQFIPSNAFFYSFPQNLSNHQNLTPQTSQNQPMSNHQNCLECYQQQNAYYNGNNFIAANYPFVSSLLPLQPYSLPSVNPNLPNTNNQMGAHGVNPKVTHFMPQFQYNYMHFIPQNFFAMHNNESQSQSQCSNQNSTSSMANIVNNQQTNSQSQQENFVSESTSQPNNSLDNSRPSSSYDYALPENTNNFVLNNATGQNQVNYNKCFNNENSNGRHFYSPCYPVEFNGNIFWSNQNNPNTVSGDPMSSHNLIMVNYPCDNTSNGYSSNSVSNGTNFQTETY